MWTTFFQFFLLSVGFYVKDANSHGRLMDPPARNCMWRFGYPTPVNYDDNQLWCGGRAVMIQQNGGKCGVCGDSYSDPIPRAHESGGPYAQGIVVKRYAAGQIFEVEVELTANHQGTFQFKLCPVKDPNVEVTQDCLDSYKLKVIDETGLVAEKYTIMSQEMRKTFNFRVKLPQFISCSHCVLQWTYVTANTWGTCSDGSEAVGCGGQETFINCMGADIAIIQNTGGRPPKLEENNTILPLIPSRMGAKTLSDVIRHHVCMGTGPYEGDTNMDLWCQENCLRLPSNCPANTCKCPTTCKAVGNLEGRPGADAYCLDQCLVYPPKNCTSDRCSCF